MNVHTDLHRARLASGLSLEDLLSRTALSVGVLRKIDEGRFDELPAGLYARAYVKKFAAEVGVEPEAALAHLAPVLPAAPDPLPVLRQPQAQREGTLHVQLARISASTLDALVLIVGVVGPTLFLASWSIDVELRTLLADAGGPLAAFCALPLALYFVVFDGIGGATPGHRVFGVAEPGNTGMPLRLPDILKRSVSH